MADPTPLIYEHMNHNGDVVDIDVDTDDPDTLCLGFASPQRRRLLPGAYHVKSLALLGADAVDTFTEALQAAVNGDVYETVRVTDASGRSGTITVTTDLDRFGVHVCTQPDQETLVMLRINRGPGLRKSVHPAVLTDMEVAELVLHIEETWGSDD